MWRRQSAAAVAITAFALATFFIVEMWRVPLLTDPEPLFSAGRWAAAVGGPLLLAADVLLPVPSSIVMVAHGTLFGVVAGSALSLLGNTLAVLVGWAGGRRGRKWILGRPTDEQRSRAHRLLDRWGPAAIIITRPLPIIAETVTIMAGANGIRLIPTVVAGALGSLPIAIAYAVTGAYATTLMSTSIVFLVLAALSAAALLLGRPVASAKRIHRR
jgi:uncharacterized membrane protein YdjX (TVP38/TMEM64 family)